LKGTPPSNMWGGAGVGGGWGWGKPLLQGCCCWVCFGVGGRPAYEPVGWWGGGGVCCRGKKQKGGGVGIPRVPAAEVWGCTLFVYPISRWGGALIDACFPVLRADPLRDCIERHLLFKHQVANPRPPYAYGVLSTSVVPRPTRLCCLSLGVGTSLYPVNTPMFCPPSS